MANLQVDEVGSPAVLSGADMIARNQNSQADRLMAAFQQQAALTAQAKMHQKALDTQIKTTQMQLESNALEHKKYQDFQAQQAEKNRAAEEAQNKLAMAQRDSHFQATMKANKEVTDRANKMQDAMIELRAKKAISASDLANEHETAIQNLAKEHQDVEAQQALTELELAKAQNGSTEFGSFLSEVAEKSDAARAKQGELGISIGETAIEQAVQEGISNLKGAFKGFFQSVTSKLDDPSVSYAAAAGNPSKKSTAIAGTMALVNNPVVLKELAYRFGSTISSYLGEDGTVLKNQLTDSALLASKIAPIIASKLSSVATSGTPADVEAATNKFLASFIAAGNVLAPDGALKGQDKGKAVDQLEADASALSDLVGESTVQGLAKSLKSLGDVEHKVRSQNSSAESLTESEQKAQYKNFSAWRSGADAFDFARNRTGSKLSPVDYDKKHMQMGAKVLEAYAKASTTPEELQAILKSHGIDNRMAQDLVDKFKERKYDIPTLTARMQQIKDQKAALPFKDEMLAKKMQVEAMRRGANLDLEMLNTLGGGN